MNLKQIIQSQKTQKFDLTSLVRDTEETLHESSTGSSSGAAATSSTWATIKSLYEGMISEQSKIPALKNGQLRQNQAGERYFWYLNNKTGKPIASTDANADRQQYTIINPDDEEADKIPKNERPSQEDADTKGQETGDQPQDTDTATEPSQGTGTDEAQKSYDDELADLLSKDDDDKE